MWFLWIDSRLLPCFSLFWDQIRQLSPITKWWTFARATICRYMQLANAALWHASSYTSSLPWNPAMLKKFSASFERIKVVEHSTAVNAASKAAQFASNICKFELSIAFRFHSDSLRTVVTLAGPLSNDTVCNSIFLVWGRCGRTRSKMPSAWLCSRVCYDVMIIIGKL